MTPKQRALWTIWISVAVIVVVLFPWEWVGEWVSDMWFIFIYAQIPAWIATVYTLLACIFAWWVGWWSADDTWLVQELGVKVKRLERRNELLKRRVYPEIYEEKKHE